MYYKYCGERKYGMTISCAGKSGTSKSYDCLEVHFTKSHPIITEDTWWLPDQELFEEITETKFLAIFKEALEKIMDTVEEGDAE